MTRITVVRHGRTDVNARGLLLGRADPGLDDLGRQQAALLAKALAGSGAAKVVASPLRRCQETAAFIADALGVGVMVDERWIEMDYGELDGVAIDSVPIETWAEWMTDVRWTPPGGESIAGLGERVRAACDDLIAAGDDVIVVSHVSPVKAAVAWALNVGDEIAWRMFVSPASITRIEHARGRATLHAFNDVSHLHLLR
jgi:broad specificity phosphatase PhoE